MTLELENTPEGSVRRKIVKSIRGMFHLNNKHGNQSNTSLIGARRVIRPGMPSSPALTEVLKKQLDSVSSSLSEPICHSLTEWNAKSDLVRTDEVCQGILFD
jgi:5'-nucleotidase